MKLTVTEYPLLNVLKWGRIGIVAGRTFYEHPSLGDESPLVYIVDGEMIVSDYWDLSDAMDGHMNGEF